ncbi:LPXTG cell wall anchor domain-containing protein [Staphylococcus epidermidis]|nr:LPXTG cell wall anchor domain-containing protein [Staphylococcus epidermidis]
MDHHSNSDKSNSKSESEDNEKKLPDTGSNNNEGTLIGSLLAIVGSLFVFGRRKNKQNTEK